MLSWLRRRKTAERIDAEADALIDELGVDAYAEARRREYESSGDAIALRWNQVALAVAHKTGKRIGLDTSTRMAMNAVFAPDREHTGAREPRPFSSGDELKSTLALQPFRLQFISLAPDCGPSVVTELEMQASDASAAIVAAANVELPPRTIGLRILDSAGNEVFSRRRGDRSKKAQMTKIPSEALARGSGTRSARRAAACLAGPHDVPVCRRGSTGRFFNVSRRERPSKTLLRGRARLRAPHDSLMDRAIRSSRGVAGQSRLSLRGDAVRLRSRPCARRSAAEDRACSDREYARGARSESRGA